METRQVTQVHIYYLLLNGVYDRCESRDIVAVADSKEKLHNLYNRELLSNEERFRDTNGYFRSFKSDGVLYNYNSIPFFTTGEYECYDDLGIKDDWIDIDSLPRLKSKYNWIES